MVVANKFVCFSYTDTFYILYHYCTIPLFMRKSFHYYYYYYAPAWMTKGRTVLIQNGILKGRDVSNYRPITCLPLIWKLLTGLIADEVYNYLETENLLPEEQKGCRRHSKGTADLLYIDRVILKYVRMRKKNLAVGWIDYQKAYDNAAHSWVLECLTILGLMRN